MRIRTFSSSGLTLDEEKKFRAKSEKIEMQNRAKWLKNRSGPSWRVPFEGKVTPYLFLENLFLLDSQTWHDSFLYGYFVAPVKYPTVIDGD